MSTIVTGYATAIDALYTIANNILLSLNPALSIIKWPGSDESVKPDTSTYWARVSDQLINEQQAALASDSIGQRPYISTGLIIVQLFCPKDLGTLAVVNGVQMASAIRNAFRKPYANGTMSFRKQNIKPLIYNSDNYQFNIVSTFDFKEIV